MNFLSQSQRQLSKRLLLSACLVCSSALASSSISIPTREEAAKVNNDTIGVVFTHEELFHQLVHNMEDELERDSGLRIVPVMGKNHVQSVYDLLYLKGIDLALVRADAIEYVKRKGNYPTIQRIVKNVAKVSEEKIVVIASKDYKTIDDLAGQAVGFGLPGSGEFVTGTIAFETLGIEPASREIDNLTAIKQIKSGELAAMVYLLRAPDAPLTGGDLQAAAAVNNLKQEDGLHLLALPESDELAAIYTPAKLTNDDLPEILSEDDSINTYSVDAILAAYQWSRNNPRSQKSRRFVSALVDNLEGLQSGAYQEAWKRVDLTLVTPNVATLPLVTRAIEEIDAEKARLARVAKAEVEAKEAQAKKNAELIEKRDQLTERLKKEINEADAARLERILGELSEILESSDAAGAD